MLTAAGRTRAFVFVVLASLPFTGNSGPRPDTSGTIPTADIRTDHTMVLIPATVVNEKDQIIEDLSRESFRLFVNGKDEEIRDVWLEEGPVSLGIVLDTSRSMRPVLPRMRETVRVLLRSTVPDDELFLTTFAAEPQLVVEPTTNQLTQVEHAVDELVAEGGTAIWDALSLAVEQARRSRLPRRALVLITDGEDTSSRLRWKEIRRVLEEADVRLYILGLPTWHEDGMFNQHQLISLVEAAGGRYFDVSGKRDLVSTVNRIDVHRYYILSFVPDPTLLDSGKQQRVDIKLRAASAGPRLKVFWKRGFRGFKR